MDPDENPNGGTGLDGPDDGPSAAGEDSSSGPGGDSSSGPGGDSSSGPGGDPSSGPGGDPSSGPGGTATVPNTIEGRLEDALERVAHGATVSVPAILLATGLTVSFTAVLTNGFGAAAYGLFVLADRLQEFLVALTAGFDSGLSRFLPDASPAERDALATFASLILLTVATVFGTALYLSAPVLVSVTDHGPSFELFVRLFAVGLPASVWLRTVGAVLRGLEEVGAFNLTLRLGAPAAHLVVAAVATYLFRDLVVVIVGVLLATGLVGLLAAAWLVATRDVGVRLRGVTDSRIRARYLRYSVSVFVGRVATTVQRLGFYPLILVLLSDVAGGVFAIGILVGTLVRLPLIGTNQFISPVAASLHEGNHPESLRRLYQVTSRLILTAGTALAVPLLVYRRAVMGVFGPEFVAFAPLLTGFVLGTYAESAAGSVGILLRMTDHERAWLLVNVAVTVGLLATAIPLTLAFGLPGLVVAFLLLLVVNNGLETAVLYRLERMQPFTRRHANPLVSAVPFALVAVAVRATVPGRVGALLGTAAGLVVYAAVLSRLGFTTLEVRLVRSLLGRYRETVRALHRTDRG